MRRRKKRLSKIFVLPSLLHGQESTLCGETLFMPKHHSRQLLKILKDDLSQKNTPKKSHIFQSSDIEKKMLFLLCHARTLPKHFRRTKSKIMSSRSHVSHVGICMLAIKPSLRGPREMSLRICRKHFEELTHRVCMSILNFCVNVFDKHKARTESAKKVANNTLKMIYCFKSRKLCRVSERLESVSIFHKLCTSICRSTIL